MTKYLIFELFSGVGFCNQLFSLETAIYLANISKRKLILLIKSPLCHCGRASWDYGYIMDYFSNSYEKFLPQGKEIYYKIIPENVKNMINSSECKKIELDKGFSSYVFIDSKLSHNNEDIRLFANGRKEIIIDFDAFNDIYLYINKSNASRCFYNFYTTKSRYLIMSKICASLTLLNNNIICNYVNTKFDLSIHLRLGDFYKKSTDINRIFSSYTNNLLKTIDSLDNINTIVLMCDRKDCDIITLLKNKYVIKFSDELIETMDNPVKDFLLEKNICHKSTNFIGTQGSTVSNHINYMRYLSNKNYNLYTRRSLVPLLNNNYSWNSNNVCSHSISWTTFWRDNVIKLQCLTNETNHYNCGNSYLTIIDEININPSKNKKIISFCLYGLNRERNRKRDFDKGVYVNYYYMKNHNYKDWTMRIYMPYNEPFDIIENIKQFGDIELVLVDTNVCLRALRFLPNDDPNVLVWLSRDLDSIINTREEKAVNDWLENRKDKELMIMSDYPQHTWTIAGGMFGKMNNTNDNSICSFIVNYSDKNSNNVNKFANDCEIAEEGLYNNTNYIQYYRAGKKLENSIPFPDLSTIHCNFIGNISPITKYYTDLQLEKHYPFLSNKSDINKNDKFLYNPWKCFFKNSEPLCSVIWKGDDFVLTVDPKKETGVGTWKTLNGDGKKLLKLNTHVNILWEGKVYREAYMPNKETISIKHGERWYNFHKENHKENHKEKINIQSLIEKYNDFYKKHNFNIKPTVWNPSKSYINKSFTNDFRGHNAYVWQTNINFEKLYNMTKKNDIFSLLDKTKESGSNGCKTFKIDNTIVSRDLLDSVIEITYLKTKLPDIENMNIIEIGGGYGRLCKRFLDCYPNSNYYVTDGIPQSTYFSKKYLKEKGNHVINLFDIENKLSKMQFDIAINIHSFPECNIGDIEWWIKLIHDKKIRYIFFVPNNPQSTDTFLPTNKKESILDIFTKYNYKVIDFSNFYKECNIKYCYGVPFFILENNNLINKIVSDKSISKSSERKIQNIVIYSNCQGKGISYFLKKVIPESKITIIENYDIIKNNKEINKDILQKADIFIYQPISENHNKYSTSINIKNNILNHLKPECKKIAFPYIYNDSLWIIIPPAIIDNYIGNYNESNKYINTLPIEKLKSEGKTIDEIIELYKNNAIDFNYKERFDNSIKILKEKEQLCDVIVSDYIEENIKNEKLFFTQNHPTTSIFIHCVNQILDLLKIDHKFKKENYKENEINLPGSWIHTQYDINYWSFNYDVKLEKYFGENHYIQHIRNIYDSVQNIYHLPFSIPSKIIKPLDITLKSKITLCIPCVDKHIPLLLKLLGTVDGFTRKPDKIMIGLSPKFNDSDLFKEKNKILQLYPELPIDIIVQITKTNAAKHLNIMGKNVKEGYIIRADADDIIHPQKIEIIEQVINKYPDTKLLLHKVRCSNTRNYNVENFNHINCANIENNVFNVECKTINNSLLLCSDMLNKKYNRTLLEFLDRSNYIHYGACCYHVGVLQNIQYKNRNFAEDKIFSLDVTKHYSKTKYIDLYLNLYVPSQSWR